MFLSAKSVAEHSVRFVLSYTIPMILAFTVVYYKDSVKEDTEMEKEYWVYAVQYYSLFDLSRNIFGADVERRRELVHEKEVFHKFHTALLGMLLYLDRKKCLTELLYYSHSFPYSYPLCCNSLQTIFDEWKIFFQGGTQLNF